MQLPSPGESSSGTLSIAINHGAYLQVSVLLQSVPESLTEPNQNMSDTFIIILREMNIQIFLLYLITILK